MLNYLLLFALAYLATSFILHALNWKHRRWKRLYDREKYLHSHRAYISGPDGVPGYVVIEPGCPPEAIDSLRALADAAEKDPREGRIPPTP